MRLIEIISGLLLIAIGIVQVKGILVILSAGLANTNFSLEEAILGQGNGSAPSLIVAAFAGFLSFASPCVLPLIQPTWDSSVVGQSMMRREITVVHSDTETPTQSALKHKREICQCSCGFS